MIEKFEILPRPDAFNANKRYYSSEVLAKAMVEYNELVREGKAIVIIGPPTEENSLVVDLTKSVGEIVDIELNDSIYEATIKFDRPTKDIAKLLEDKKSWVVGLNQLARINENFEVSDVKIISASILPDPRLQIDPMEDLQYFVDKFKERPSDHRLRNQIVTLIDAIYTKEKIKSELKNDNEKDWTQENT